MVGEKRRGHRGEEQDRGKEMASAERNVLGGENGAREESN